MIYVFMPFKETKEELIESMVFFKDFGDIWRYLKKTGLVKGCKESALVYNSPISEDFGKPIGMGPGWRYVKHNGAIVGFWNDRCVSSEYYRYIGAGCPLKMSDKISKEKSFAGYFHLNPDIPLNALYKIDFTIDTGVDYREFVVVFMINGGADEALERFNKWITPKLRGDEEIAEKYTKITKVEPMDGVVYQNVFNE